jgi:hypothetical protein
MAKQRRNKGSGTVFRRNEDKLYVGGVELPKNKDGTRNQKRVYSKTRAGAEAKLAGIRSKKRK